MRRDQGRGCCLGAAPFFSPEPMHPQAAHHPWGRSLWEVDKQFLPHGRQAPARVRALRTESMVVTRSQSTVENNVKILHHKMTQGKRTDIWSPPRRVVKNAVISGCVFPLWGPLNLLCWGMWHREAGCGAELFVEFRSHLREYVSGKNSFVECLLCAGARVPTVCGQWEGLLCAGSGSTYCVQGAGEPTVCGQQGGIFNECSEPKAFASLVQVGKWLPADSRQDYQIPAE